MVRLPDEVDADTTVAQPLSITALWFGVLGAPAAFMIGLVALYALTAPPCGQRHMLLLHAVHATTLAFTMVSTAVAWWMQRAVRRPSKAGTIGSGVRLMAQVGAGGGVLFVIATLVQWLAEFLAPRCG